MSYLNFNKTLNNISLGEFNKLEIETENYNYNFFNVSTFSEKLKNLEDNIKYIFREGEVIISIGLSKDVIRLTNIFIYKKYRSLGIFTLIEKVLSIYFDKIEIISVQTKRFARHLYSMQYRPLYDGSVSFCKNIYRI